MNTEISMRAILEVARSRETVTKAKINREVKLIRFGGVENKEINIFSYYLTIFMRAQEQLIPFDLH